MTAPYRPRKITLRSGRVVTLRAIRPSDEQEIRQAFERLSEDSRYTRFMAHKREIDAAALERGLRPLPGQEFTFVATVPAADGIDIVGAARYLRSDANDARAASSRSPWPTPGTAAASAIG